VKALAVTPVTALNKERNYYCQPQAEREQKMSKTIAVTGGTGYIAGFVIAEFLNHGYMVRTSVRSSSKMEALKKELSAFVKEEAMSRLSAFEADLTSSEGWADGFSGADGIIHVASPLGHGTESAEELRCVAEGGTLNVLQGALDAGVKRVVMTSSQAASTPRISVGKVVLDESFWSDDENPELDSYRLSKIASEKAAWAFSKKHGLDLTAILPGAVFGQVMSARNISSNNILLRLINGAMPCALNIPLEVSNVRDLAELHRLAFENDNAIGERFLAASQTIRMPEVARIYREQYPDSKTPLNTFPNWMVRFLAIFIPDLRSMVPMLGREYSHTTEKAEGLLGWIQHTPRETVLDAAASFKQLGMIKSRSY
jgi:nucleoside-diphosphate-sugar epimerase